MNRNLMNKKETRLLVEDWRRLLTQQEEDELLEESFLRYAPLALGMLSSFLGGLSGTSTANAMPPEEIADQLHVEFNKEYPGVFEIYTDDQGRVVGFREKSGKSQVILTEPQCENIDQDELDRAIDALRGGSYRDYRGILDKAAESGEDDAQRNASKEKRDLHTRINDISNDDIKRIKDEYRQKTGDGPFNVHFTQLHIAASKIFDDPNSLFSKYKSSDHVLVYLILKNDRSLRHYIPKK